ncbi:Alanyl-tRNA editing protein Aarsd1-A-like [Homarus americanus]|uniref:Alanyl-tRNA editing protein Aarsd1-A-like n=1 Tax=Homarus americanus TaxID=6706 RepID=A0A8J5JD68_HOMAM|nr:Alanyl-tRNA editing protein Aarsd1-A-like [Homarus americanus]
MVFYCQRHCYDKKYTTNVVSCKPAKQDVVVNGKKKKIDCYETTFEDTVMFPEGGGQPDDRGTVEGIPVLRVQRRGGDAVHYLEKPLEVGAIVTQQIDWDRRHDHMQQHSAQHLITAVADAMYGYATNSWYLAESISYIELDTTKVSTAEINTIEETVNQRIKDATPVHIEEYDATDPKLREIRTRGLPDDVVGPVRVVTIEGVDANMCCGTHVRNLADLQAIKLLHTEKGKANKTLLYFVAGARVLRYLGECVSRERQFNILLHSCSSDHLRLVEKIQKDLKSMMIWLCEILEGRGGGKSRFTGKVTKLGKRGEAEKYILGVMDNHKTES